MIPHATHFLTQCLVLARSSGYKLFERIKQMACLFGSRCVCACVHSFLRAVLYMCSFISVERERDKLHAFHLPALRVNWIKSNTCASPSASISCSNYLNITGWVSKKWLCFILLHHFLQHEHSSLHRKVVSSAVGGPSFIYGLILFILIVIIYGKKNTVQRKEHIIKDFKACIVNLRRWGQLFWLIRPLLKTVGELHWAWVVCISYIYIYMSDLLCHFSNVDTESQTFLKW